MIYYLSVAVSAAVAGIVSLDWRIGAIAGIVDGLYVLPLTLFSIPGFDVRTLYLFWTIEDYKRNFLMHILIAWVGGTVGGIAPQIVDKITHKIREKMLANEPHY